MDENDRKKWTKMIGKVGRKGKKKVDENDRKKWTKIAGKG